MLILQPEGAAVGEIQFFIDSVSDDQKPAISVLLLCLFYKPCGIVDNFSPCRNLVWMLSDILDLCFLIFSVRQFSLLRK